MAMHFWRRKGPRRANPPHPRTHAPPTWPCQATSATAVQALARLPARLRGSHSRAHGRKYPKPGGAAAGARAARLHASASPHAWPPTKPSPPARPATPPTPSGTLPLPYGTLRPLPQASRGVSRSEKPRAPPPTSGVVPRAPRHPARGALAGAGSRVGQAACKAAALPNMMRHAAWHAMPQPCMPSARSLRRPIRRRGGGGRRGARAGRVRRVAPQGGPTGWRPSVGGGFARRPAYRRGTCARRSGGGRGGREVRAAAWGRRRARAGAPPSGRPHGGTWPELGRALGPRRRSPLAFWHDGVHSPSLGQGCGAGRAGTAMHRGAGGARGARRGGEEQAWRSETPAGGELLALPFDAAAPRHHAHQKPWLGGAQARARVRG